MAHNVCDRVLQKQDPVLHTVKIPVKLYIIVFVFGYITYHITVDLWSVLSVSALLVMIVSPYFRYFNIRRIIGFVVVFALGVLWGVIPEQIINHSYSYLDGTEYNGSAIINSTPEKSGKRISFRCRLEDKNFKNANCHITIYSDDFSSEIGDKIEISDTIVNFYPLQKINAQILQGENYSSERTYLGMNPEKIVFTGQSKTFSLQKYIYRFREKINDCIQIFLDKESFLFVSGILTGNRDNSEREFYDTLSALGLSHVIVVSGMHFTLLISLLMFLLKLTNLNELSICIAGCCFSGLIALFFGFTPSVVRALIMSLMYIISDYRLNDTQDSLHKVLATALIMILANPFIIHDAGFVLSFLSVAGIILFSKVCTFRIRYISKRISEAVAVTLSANILTFPILIMYFGKASFSFVIGNLLVTPFVSVIMFYGIPAVLVATLFNAVAPYVFLPLKFISGVLLTIIKLLSYLPLNEIKFIVPAIEIIIIYYVIIVLLKRAKKSPKIYSTLCVVLSIIFVANIVFPSGYLKGNKAEYYSLCGKQSGKVAVNYGLYTAVVDFSSSNEYYDLYSVINKKCRGKVDVFIINTMEALNSLEKLAQRISIKKVIVPEAFLKHMPTVERLNRLCCEIDEFSGKLNIKTGNMLLTSEGTYRYNIDKIRIKRKNKELVIHSSKHGAETGKHLNIFTYDNFRYMEFNNICIPENVVNNQYEGIIIGTL